MGPSVDAVSEALDRIEIIQHLNAFISVAPREIAITQAQKLDEERVNGSVRSPLHGMPIAIKDAVVTHPEYRMPTTAGCRAFEQMTAVANAPIVDRLVDAGLIVIGKTNMTEQCGLKDKSTPIGYSTVGGQVRSPFARDSLPDERQPISGGSSAGSAVSVAAGAVSLAIGTETSGSNVWPASCCGIFGLTLSYGSAPTEGVFRISQTFDRIGLMAKDPHQLQALMEVVIGRRVETCNERVRIGVARPEWGLYGPDQVKKWTSETIVSQYEAKIASLAVHADIVYPVDLPDPSLLSHNGNTLHSVALYEHQAAFKDFLTSFEPFEGIKDVAGLVKWNVDNAERAMRSPFAGQSLLEDVLETTMTPQSCEGTISHVRRVAGPDGLKRIMDEIGLNILLSNSASNLVSYAAWLGWPIATFPVGRHEDNGQPWGMFAVARPNREDLLLSILRAAA